MVNEVKHIVDVIRNGGVVLMQVDTIFGLICDGLNNEAISKVENIKHRIKPSFGFFVRDVDVAKKYAIMSDVQEKCFKTVFPGYFTLILPASVFSIKNLESRTLGEVNGVKTIGLRIPKNDFCLQVLDFFKTPLVATSANISGKKTATKFEEIDNEIINSVDAVYYDKNISIAGLSSTIVDITDIRNYKVIRNGSGNIDVFKENIFDKN